MTRATKAHSWALPAQRAIRAVLLGPASGATFLARIPKPVSTGFLRTDSQGARDEKARSNGLYVNSRRQCDFSPA